VRRSFDEIRDVSAHSARITRRLRAALLDLFTVAPADRRTELNRQLELRRPVSTSHPHARRQLFDWATEVT
jgi:hypothetical protein